MTIATGNIEIDAMFAELEGQVLSLTEQNAVKAGRIAALQAQNTEQKQKIEALLSPKDADVPAKD